MDLWSLLKDIALTGTGVGVIIAQAFSRRPNELLLGVALVLIAPRAYRHVKAMLPGSGGGQSSESPPQRPSSPPGRGRGGVR